MWVCCEVCGTDISQQISLCTMAPSPKKSTTRRNVLRQITSNSSRRKLGSLQDFQCHFDLAELLASKALKLRRPGFPWRNCLGQVWTDSRQAQQLSIGHISEISWCYSKPILLKLGISVSCTPLKNAWPVGDDPLHQAMTSREAFFLDHQRATTSRWHITSDCNHHLDPGKCLRKC